MADTVKKVNTVLLYIGQPAMIISSVLDTRLTMSARDIGELFVLAVIMQLLLMIFAYIFIPIFAKKLFLYLYPINNDINNKIKEIIDTGNCIIK